MEVRETPRLKRSPVHHIILETCTGLQAELHSGEAMSRKWTLDFFFFFRFLVAQIKDFFFLLFGLFRFSVASDLRIQGNTSWGKSYSGFFFLPASEIKGFIRWLEEHWRRKKGGRARTSGGINAWSRIRLCSNLSVWLWDGEEHGDIFKLLGLNIRFIALLFITVTAAWIRGSDLRCQVLVFCKCWLSTEVRGEIYFTSCILQRGEGKQKREDLSL